MLKPLTREEVGIHLTAEADQTAVLGNASASGVKRIDREIEQEIFERLNRGDVWAWADVTVTVSWGPFSAIDTFGGCNYENEEEFRQPGGYFDDMVDEALAKLNRKIMDYYQILRGRELGVAE